MEPRIHGSTPPVIGWQEVMRSSSGCHFVGYHLCRAKYGGDKDSITPVIAGLAHCLLIAGEKSLIEQDHANRIARLIVNMFIDPRFERCPKCNLTKNRMYKGVKKACESCDGTGLKTLSNDQIAKYCCIDRDTFRNRKYIDLFKEYQAKMGEWETSTLFIMDAKLFGDERVAV